MKRDKLYTVNKWNRKLWDGGVIPIDNYIEGDTLNFQARMSDTKEMLNNETIDPISIKGINVTNGINDTSNIGDVVGMASTALGIVGTAKQNAQIDNTAVNRIEDTIEENNNATASASSFDTLEDQWALWTPQESISWRDIRGGNAGSALNSVSSAASSGASIGSTLGPIGGAIGGIFGGLASGIGSLVGRRRAKKKAAELNRKIKEANFHRINTFNQNAENLDIQQDKIAALNFFSEGGKIHIKPENRGKFTALKKRTGKSATWFKEHGTPSQKKMAIFALNARKWKHEDGGPLNPYSAGALVDAIYSFSNGDKFLGKPSHNYDFTISEEEANKLGYYPDERGHRDDRVKKPAHPTHPSRGKWNSFEEFELTDKGMENPNYTLFGLVDGGQDPQAVMTYKGGIVLPEITVTPKGSYIMNPYDNIKIFDKGGYLTNKKSFSRRLNNNYKEGEIYDVTEEEVKMLKELGYEFEYVQ